MPPSLNKTLSDALMSKVDLPAEFSTPMMQQYLKIKAQYQDCIVLYRLGDFYEMFLDDALEGAEILDITLTSRTRGKDGRIPMAGVPYHAVDNYLHKLIKAGRKVAICEQVTEPGKGLVEREVVRVISPGTFIDERHVARKEHLYIAAVVFEKNRVATTAIDVSTGEVLVGFVETPELVGGRRGKGKNLDKKAASEHFQNSDVLKTVFNEIETLLHPAEVLVSEENSVSLFEETAQNIFRFVQKSDDFGLDTEVASQVVRQQFGQAILASPLFVTQGTVQTTAAVLRYLSQTQKTSLPHLRPPREMFTPNHLKMDASTVANLEVFDSLRSTTQHISSGPQTVLDVIDQTKTAMGGRLIRQWLRQPLTDIEKIEKRLEKIEYLVKERQLRTQLQEKLRKMIDIERLLSRIALKLSSPKDLRSLIEMLGLVWETKELISLKQHAIFEKAVEKIGKDMLALRNTLEKVIVEDPSFDPRSGNIVRSGYNTQLDELRSTVSSSQEWMANLEKTERQKTGISSLKIRFNQVFGFYIEVSRANLDAVPDYFQRKQTLVNAERFITPELKKHEEIILNAKSVTDQIEYDVFQEMVELVNSKLQSIQPAISVIAELDVLTGLADVAIERQYSRPEFVDDVHGKLEIVEGRHPVVETSTLQRFVPNSVTLAHDFNQLLVLTGPNMAGKSVFMRQTALIVLLAQIGSFVPAKSARLSITDRIFVRSGAADMITAGLSTFMVEMVETANILQNATCNSLVVMDEIGRGTSTYDGISIAWSVAEALVTAEDKRRPKTLFATHYHELNELAKKHSEIIQNNHMGVAKDHDKLVFLYTLQPGESSHSYGLEVARLAGVPKHVIDQAEKMLQKLENGHQL